MGEALRHQAPPASPRRSRPGRSWLRRRDREADVPVTTSLGSTAGQSARRGSRSHHAPATRTLLNQARQGLLDAEYSPRPVDRYARAHLAALRAAAAVLAARSRPRRRGRPVSAWQLLPKVAPELAEWSEFFAATSATRAAAEAGACRLVTTRTADDLVRQAGEFISLAERAVSGTSR
ncbi:MAG TPA: SAV_6107 family HEPN domain-containing protein [Pseudonocardiaceae bacterium]|nr:SAV_6107 family HEPN domain-containing protein [Pseudonocardiaceae bacterium]